VATQICPSLGGGDPNFPDAAVEMASLTMPSLIPGLAIRLGLEGWEEHSVPCPTTGAGSRPGASRGSRGDGIWGFDKS
jgi:hypothetical protein